MRDFVQFANVMRELVNSVSTVAFTVLLVFLLPLRSPSALREDDAVFKISTPLEFKGRVISISLRKSDIAALLDLPVRNGNSDLKEGYGVEMTKANYEKMMVSTCRQWQKALEEKAYSATTYDMAMESSLIHTCGLLFELRHAKQPLKSFVANPKVTVADLKLLPAGLLADYTDNNEKRAERVGGLTLFNAVPPNDIHEVNDKTLTLSYGGFRQSFWEGARADFDADGIEDIFICTGGRAEGGTMGYSDYFILTRTTPSGPLKMIETTKPWQTNQE